MKKKRARKLFCTVVARIIDPKTGEEAGLLQVVDRVGEHAGGDDSPRHSWALLA